MNRFVWETLKKTTKFIIIEDIFKWVSGKNCWQYCFKSWCRHFFGNRLGLARNSFKRYIISREKDEIENYYYNMYHKPYRTLTIPLKLHLISLTNSENIAAVKPSIKDIFCLEKIPIILEKSYEIEAFVMGHHVYKQTWTSFVWEKLDAIRGNAAK